MNIHVEHSEAGIVTVLINQPAKRNAMTLDMYRNLGLAFSELEGDDNVRCIVIRGAGNNFCAGSDIDSFETERNDREHARNYAEFTSAMTDFLCDSRHPTIACID